MSNHTKESLKNMSNNSGEILSNFYTNDSDLVTINNRNVHNLLNQNAPKNIGYAYYQKNSNEIYKSTNPACSNYYMSYNHNNFYQKENESSNNYLMTRHKSFPTSPTLLNDNYRKNTNDLLYSSIENFNKKM